MEKKKTIKKLPLLEQFRHLKDYLVLAGIKASPAKIFFLLIFLAAAIDIAVLSFIIIKLLPYSSFVFIIILSLIFLTLGFSLVFIMVWLGFLVALDYLKFKRKIELEEVLPEFLRLVSANHRAGFSLEISLWKANRPRFGILSKEINEVAKNTYASGNLIMPLIKFATKYDSNMLKRVISNMIEGLKTGADISNLLDNVADNITTIKNTRKELASEVENYMLFITITVLVISPLMFGLTHKMSGLIESVKNILAGTMGPDTAMPQSPVPMTFEKSATDFRYFFDIFVYLMVATNSVISVLLMSMVKYGNVKQDLKKIPVYYIVGICMYILSKLVFANFLNVV